MELPKELRYKEYVWAKVDGDSAAIGVTDYALKTVKDIVFIDLPKKGTKITAGDEFVALESVKWSGRVASPLSGEITDVNDVLFDEPDKLNSEPYSAWICKIKLSNPSELSQMLDSEAATEWVKKNM